METKCVSDFEFKMLVTILVTYPISFTLQHEDKAAIFKISVELYDANFKFVNTQIHREHHEKT